MLPRELCRSARAPRESTRALWVGRAAVEKEEVNAGRAKRQIERVSNTILSGFIWGLGYFRGEREELGIGRGLEGKEAVLLADDLLPAM
jgi:hypothetical protein